MDGRREKHRVESSNYRTIEEIFEAAGRFCSFPNIPGKRNGLEVGGHEGEDRLAESDIIMFGGGGSRANAGRPTRRSRVLAGALGGSGGTIVLSGLREALKRFGLVFDTAPAQVVDRIVEDLSAGAHRALTATAHFAYGVGAGAVLGFLRREPGELTEEAAVGSALGVLIWGAGWASWLPLTGVHRALWPQSTPRSCCPYWTTLRSVLRGESSIGRSRTNGDKEVQSPP